MAMKAYENYKNVDLPWLKRVPEHWGIKRIRQVLHERKERNFPIKTKNILSLTNTRGVIPYEDKGNVGNKSKSDLGDYFLAYPNDIVLNSMNVVIGSVGLSAYFGAISPVYYALYNTDPNSSVLYFNTIFSSKIFQQSLKCLGNGILDIRKRISAYDLKNVMIPVPPKEEQDQIVRYLDWQNSRLNKLINAKKKEIALLEEQKQALISQAVTKGLDPNAPLKDSGIDWIGQIPEHWQIKMLCQLARPKKIQKPTNKMYPVLSLSYGRIIQKKDINAGLVPTTYDNYQLVIEGDIILRFTDLQNDHTSLRTGLVQQEGIITSAYTCIRPNKISKYLHMLLHSCDVHKVFYGMGSGIRQSIGYKDVRYMKLPFPPLKEQIDIVNFIDKQINKINSYIKSIQAQVSLLEEYRTRLVADVVTGQIDVRNTTIPNYETVTKTIDQPETDEDSTICTEDQ